MFKNILIATDGSKLSDKAVAHAIGLARALGARLTAFYAAPDFPLPAYADGVVYEPVSRKEYAKLAAEDAKKHKCDAIVMASHGRRGVSALLLGSETQKVLTHSKLPVMVVR